MAALARFLGSTAGAEIRADQSGFRGLYKELLTTPTAIGGKFHLGRATHGRTVKYNTHVAIVTESMHGLNERKPSRAFTSNETAGSS